MMDDCLMTEYHILIDTDMICSAWFDGEALMITDYILRISGLFKLKFLV